MTKLTYTLADLPPEMAQAVRDFAARYGRQWKHQLTLCWVNGWGRHGGGYSASWVGQLQSLRNSPTLGSRWLEKAKLP